MKGRQGERVRLYSRGLLIQIEGVNTTGSSSSLFFGNWAAFLFFEIGLPTIALDDQEGTKTVDDDNFINDSGVDPAHSYGSDKEHSASRAPQSIARFSWWLCSCPNEGGCLGSDKEPWNDPELIKLVHALHADEPTYPKKKIISFSKDGDDLEIKLIGLKDMESEIIPDGPNSEVQNMNLNNVKVPKMPGGGAASALIKLGVIAGIGMYGVSNSLLNSDSVTPR